MGCGFKIQIEDYSNLIKLETDLEKYEAWLTNTKIKEFSTIENGIFNFDMYLPNCNNRLTTDYYPAIEWLSKFHQKTWGVRSINVLGGANDGYYSIEFGSDQAILRNEVPKTVFITDKNIYMKNINNQDITFMFSECSFKSGMFEWDGAEYRDFTFVPKIPVITENEEYAYNRLYNASTTAKILSDPDYSVQTMTYQINTTLKELLKNPECKLCLQYSLTNAGFEGNGMRILIDIVFEDTPGHYEIEVSKDELVLSTDPQQLLIDIKNLYENNIDIKNKIDRNNISEQIKIYVAPNFIDPMFPENNLILTIYDMFFKIN